jgi:Caspase domain
MRSALFFSMYLFVLFSAFVFDAAAPVQAQQKRVALVIGNSEYVNTPRLQNPKHDAADMAKTLKSLGFEVLEGVDLDKGATDRLIRDFAKALSGSSAGLFFYAGHGLQVAGQNYLIPVDAKAETAAALDFEMVRLDLIQRIMEVETKTNIIMLDACRNNPLARNLTRALGTRSIQIGQGLANVESGEGTLISFSTQPGNVALDGTGRNSPYAGALLKHIGNPGDDLTTILINTRKDVMEATNRRQVPWEHSAMTARFFFSDQTKSAKQLTPAALPSGSSGLPSPTAQHPFDGVWSIQFRGGPGCPIKSNTGTWVITKSALPNKGRGVGDVTPSGELRWKLPAKVRADMTVVYSANLKGDQGKGSYRGGPCTGSITLKRQPQS